MTDGGEGSSGLQHTQETRKKISNANKGKQYTLGLIHSEETREKMKQSAMKNKRGIGNRKLVIQYSNNNEFIKEWSSSIEVEKILNISKSNINSCAREERKSAGGFIWRYKIS
jgi:ketol-acid reductoisomerase